MIEVSIDYEKIIIEGHSYYDDVGKDIVCAAVSCLVQTLIASVNNFTDDKINYSLSKGTGKIEYGNLSSNGEILIKSFSLGVSRIAESYPENIKVIIDTLSEAQETETYKVIKSFVDLHDDNYRYSVGDIFPRRGIKVSEKRIEQLCGNKNKQKTPLVEKVKTINI